MEVVVLYPHTAVGATDHASAGAIAALSRELGLPVQQVDRIYQQELTELAAHARVRTFLGILALRQTRAILRSRAGNARGGISRTAASLRADRSATAAAR